MKKTAAILMAFLFVLAAGTSLHAAQNSPFELSADTIDYDARTGVMLAQGGARLTQDGAETTAARVEYNTKTREARLTGNVKTVRQDMTLTATEVTSTGDNLFVATGDVVLTKGEYRLTGPRVDYYADRQYARTAGRSSLQTPEGLMAADVIEAFLAEDRAVGTGNVRINSDARRLDASSDRAVYTGVRGRQGQVVLSGSARAVQDGNTLTGNTLTIFLDDKAMEASGRPKMVITPQ